MLPPSTVKTAAVHAVAPIGAAPKIEVVPVI
jgi:hypothetical protein